MPAWLDQKENLNAKIAYHIPHYKKTKQAICFMCCAQTWAGGGRHLSDLDCGAIVGVSQE